MKTDRVHRQARRLRRFLERNKTSLSPLLILTHDFPDPDAIASAVTLQYLCHLAGISSRIAYRGSIGRTENKTMVKILRLPLYKLRPNDFKNFKHVALVDTQPAFKNNPFAKIRRATIVVDQHEFVERPYSRISIVNPDVGATSVILAQAALPLRKKIPSRVATSLVYGILSDTMNLFRANDPLLIRTYLALLPFCDMKSLSLIQNPSRSRDTFLILEKGIHKAKAKQGLLVSHLGPVKSPDLISQVADFLISYKQAKWCLCTGRAHGRVYVSLRIAKKRVDAGEILRDIFDNPHEAGGHDFIAGGSFRIGLDQKEEVWRRGETDLTKRLVKRLRLRGKGEFFPPFRS